MSYTNIYHFHCSNQLNSMFSFVLYCLVTHFKCGPCIVTSILDTLVIIPMFGKRECVSLICE